MQKKLRIALIGYGKMGKEIEKIAIERGHEIALVIDLNNYEELNNLKNYNIDVAIEFTSPHSAIKNIQSCFDSNIPVVCGSTGWYNNFNEIKTECEHKNQTLFYASNFSIGVNIFFAINDFLASLMNQNPQYDVFMEEIHHTQKLDSPSGTAITLANAIIENLSRKNNWKEAEQVQENELRITAKRLPDIPGTHIVTYESSVDSIEIKHTAKNRIGFASGAVLAAEFVYNKKGIFTMKDILGI